MLGRRNSKNKLLKHDKFVLVKFLYHSGNYSGGLKYIIYKKIAKILVV